MGDDLEAQFHAQTHEYVSGVVGERWRRLGLDVAAAATVVLAYAFIEGGEL